MKIITQSLPTATAPRGGLNAADANPWLYGTIRSVEPTREMLFLHQPQNDREQIIHWLPQTRFSYHGKEVKPGALLDGQQISVHFVSDAGQKFAKEIDIVVEPTATETTAVHCVSLRPTGRGGNTSK